MKIKNKRFIGILIFIAVVLLIPFIAMQFTDEVLWSLFDFIIAGLLLLTTGLLFELIMRKVNSKEKQIALIIAVFILLALIWVELAVGLFGTPFAGS